MPTSAGAARSRRQVGGLAAHGRPPLGTGRKYHTAGDARTASGRHMYGMNGPFVDLYETLQLSPNASSETIERVYRLLAKRYHPDNQDTGDAQKFSEVHHAYDTLSDTTRRAAYDVTYEQFRGETWRIFDQDAATDDRESDRR